MPHGDSLRFGRFGAVTLYHAPNTANDAADERGPVVLLVAGPRGWYGPTDTLAHVLANLPALVVRVNAQRYLAAMARAAAPCAYPAADLEALSQFVQHQLARPAYSPPVLVGVASGAALAYAALAQSPPSTFAGAVSDGFCPQLDLPAPPCRGNAPGPLHVASPGRRWRGALAPAARLPAEWVVVADERGGACRTDSVRAFATRVAGAQFVAAPTASLHRFVLLRDAVARLGEAPARAARPVPADVRDLPLVELPASRPNESGTSGAAASSLAVIVSGDGGWASIDRQIGEALAAGGMPVVGLSSLQYFWKPRTPDGASRDLARVLRHYLAAWRADSVVLVGYSRGADVLPFLVARLPADLRARVRLVALLGLSTSASFEFHVSDWLPGTRHPDELPTAPAVAQLRPTPVLCVYGTDETDSACPSLPPGAATLVPLKGGHHFGGGYAEIVRRILAGR